MKESSQESPPASQPMDWDLRYREQNTPWDVHVPSRELMRVVQEWSIEPSPMLELGCGTGTNALWLVQHGFQVTAIDVAPLAIARARQRFEQAHVAVETLVADLFELPSLPAPYSFVFDRGVYHAVRRQDASRAVQILANLTTAGGYYLTLAGNANDPQPLEEGPPQVTASQLCEEFAPVFDLVQLREFHFEVTDIEGRPARPLAWSALWRRKSA